ncbi:MAG: type II toxin-antitoxin system HipA family toxin [Bacteroidales bacterium]|jgi:serine/threonine-protein kinase HipA|nr:type II toxin-antitoxin system HipA family toxin [Bacteroidales bacterium]
MITTAYINLWDVRVGAIFWDIERQTGFFQFTSDFLSTGLDVSPIKMPLSTQIFSFPELRSNTTFKGLPGLLADVLPDKYGNTLIDAWLLRNGRPADSLNPVEHLCFIGKRGMGALEFEPVVPDIPGESTKIELESLVNIAQNILSGRQKFRTNLSERKEKALTDILKVGTSAGGARAKAVIAYNQQTKEVRSGQAELPADFKHYLLKFDGVVDGQSGISNGYGRIEMAYYLMATEAGIEMSECQLLEENGRAHFMTRRFDRTDTREKQHVQSFCAMNHYDFNNILGYGYEHLFETMRFLRFPYSAAEQMYRRMVFNVLALNCDDHTKNFSFIMNRQGVWRLAPAFDVCYAYRPDSYWVSQHSLSVNGKRKNITLPDLLAVAKNMNIKKPARIIEQVRDAVSLWNTFAKKTGTDTVLKKEISKNLKTNITSIFRV